MSLATAELKPNLRIAGLGFERNVSGVCDLYLTVGDKSFSCACASPSARRFLGFEHWDLEASLNSETLTRLLANSELSQAVHSYRKVICGVISNETMFIPAPLYDSNTAAEQLQLAFGSEVVSKNIASEELNMMQIVNVYTQNQSITSTISGRFRQTEFHHVSAMRLRYLASISGPSKEVLMLVDVDDSVMNVTAVKASSLLFHNSFEFKTPEELTYYLLLVFEQLKLNPETAELFFTGNISKNDAAFALASRYVSNCRLSGLPGIYTYESEFAFLDANRHFNLFCGPACVS